MKSFLSSFRYFIPALIITASLGIYFGIKPPSEPPTSAKVSTAPSVSSGPLTSIPPYISSTPITPPTQRPSVLKNEAKLPSIASSQSESSDNDVDWLAPRSPNPPSLPLKSIQAEVPTHLFYQENAQNLVEIGTFYDRKESLNQEAAEAFRQMKLAAQQEGIELIPISGFRTVATQQKLFERQIQRQGSEQAAARLSAPPGFSEHHTGYAIDIGDGKRPETLLKLAFESTEVYRWLTAYAAQYGFELSFPANNSQGVSYEPWHWRFVGSSTAQEIFKKAR